MEEARHELRCSAQPQLSSFPGKKPMSTGRVFGHVSGAIQQVLFPSQISRV